MIGGGIFATLGLSLELAKGAAPIAFAIAGLVALLTSYSYAKLSARYPSAGGTIEFLVRAYGDNVLTGGLNMLLLSSYIVMIALYAHAFGAYGASPRPL
jgi:amino acid transporter